MNKSIKSESVINKNSQIPRDGNILPSQRSSNLNKNNSVKKCSKHNFTTYFILLAILSIGIYLAVPKKNSSSNSSNNQAISGISYNKNNSHESQTSENANVTDLLRSFFASLKNPEIEDDGSGTSKVVEEINNLSQEICNNDNLPADIWISPKLMSEDIFEQKKILEQLKSYCIKVNSGSASASEKKQFLELKIKLLNERNEMISKYNDILKNSIETVKSKIETAENKEIQEGMKNQLDIMEGTNNELAAAAGTENNTVVYIDTESEPGHYSRIEQNKKQIEELNIIISKYRQELINL